MFKMYKYILKGGSDHVVKKPNRNRDDEIVMESNQKDDKIVVDDDRAFSKDKFCIDTFRKIDYDKGYASSNEDTFFDLTDRNKRINQAYLCAVCGVDHSYDYPYDYPAILGNPQEIEHEFGCSECLKFMTREEAAISKCPYLDLIELCYFCWKEEDDDEDDDEDEDDGGDIEDAAELIRQGIDINAADEERNTALMGAAMTGKHKLVVFLLKQDNINPNMVNTKGETALDLANNAKDDEYDMYNTYRIHPTKFNNIITALKLANEVNKADEVKD